MEHYQNIFDPHIILKVFCNLLDFDHIYESFHWGGYAVADKLKTAGKQVG